MPLYAANGSWNVTVVPGTSFTGIYAADGSLNVVEDKGSAFVGRTHPCGALWVKYTSTDVSSIHHPNGSLYVATTAGVKGAIRVTVVSGSLGTTNPLTYSPYFWFDASDTAVVFTDTGGTTSVTADGQTVAKFNDKGSSAQHLSQASATARPQWKTSGGLSWIIGDAVDDYLSASSPFSGIGNATIMLAGRVGSANTNYGRFIDANNATGFWFGRNATTADTVGGGCLETGSPFGQFSTVTNGSDFVLVYSRTGASTEYFLNGVSQGSRSTAATNMTGTLAMCAQNGGSFVSSHRIYQAMMFDRVLTSTERNELTTYIGAKAGLTI